MMQKEKKIEMLTNLIFVLVRTLHFDKVESVVADCSLELATSS